MKKSVTKRILSTLFALVFVFAAFATISVSAENSVVLTADGAFSPELAKDQVLTAGTVITSEYTGLTGNGKLIIKLDGETVFEFNSGNMETASYTLAKDCVITDLPLTDLKIGNKTLTLETYHDHQFDTSTWTSDEDNHWHPCTAEGNSDKCADAEGSGKAAHTWGEEGEQRWICQECGYESTTRQDRYTRIDAVTSAISGLGDAEETPEYREKLDEILAMFNNLSDDEQAEVENSEQLEESTNAFSSLNSGVLGFTSAVNKLPDPENITLENKSDVEAARATYNGLSDFQKSLVLSSIVEKLEAAEARIAELEKAPAPAGGNGNSGSASGNSGSTTGNTPAANNTTTTGTGNESIAKTGGSNNTVIYLAIVLVLVVALGGIGFYFKKRKSAE